MAAILEAVDGGVDAVHVREPGGTARALFERVCEVREAVSGRAKVVVNDRVDVALAAGADGIQLGGRSLGVEDARRTAGMLPLGVSVHNGDEVRAAAGADWLLLGTVFPSRSHPGGVTLGIGGFAQAGSHASCPVLAIGGVSPENVDELLAAGAHGVAVISAILDAPSPRDAAQNFRDAIDTRYQA